MTHDFIDDDLSLNGTFIPLESIPLSLEHVAWAIQLSQSVPSEIQWQTYLNALALAGVEQWLQKRAPELVLKSKWLAGREDNFSLNKLYQPLMNKPTDATFSESICQLQVNEFKLYLIATDSLYDTQISLSKTAIESSDFIPQFYVLVEILEELEQIHIRGYLQRDWLCHRLKDDGLIHQQQSISLQPESDSAFFLPLEWFGQDSDKLLLALRCLEPTAIPVTSQEPTLRSSPLASPVQELTQRAINVGLWLRDELDQLAQDLSWILLPPLSLSSEYRSLKLPSEQFNDVVAELMNRGDMAIPSQARAVYRDLQWENIALRLYVVTWELLTTGSIPEWTLLLILGAQPNAILPLGIKLQVRDETQILEEPVLSDRSQDYLYARVIGTHNERFWVTIALAGGTALTLPPFTFDAN
jgi:hypothetical protein